MLEVMIDFCFGGKVDEYFDPYRTSVCWYVLLYTKNPTVDGSQYPAN